jgi:hypothetical protein
MRSDRKVNGGNSNRGPSLPAVKKKHGSRCVPQFLRDLLRACDLSREDWYDDLLTEPSPFFSPRANAIWRTMPPMEQGRWLTGQLWNDTGIMPWLTCEELELGRGSSYAVAARKLRAQLVPDCRTESVRPEGSKTPSESVSE